MSTLMTPCSAAFARLSMSPPLSQGMKIVKKHADLPELDFKNYVNDLIEIHDKYTMILSKVLDNNSVFQKAIKVVASFLF